MMELKDLHIKKCIVVNSYREFEIINEQNNSPTSFDGELLFLKHFRKGKLFELAA